MRLALEILEVDTEKRDGLVHVMLRGELDLSSVNKVQDELRRVEADAPSVVLLDLSKLTFLDSTGLRCLVTADQRARDAGRRLVLVRGPDPVLPMQGHRWAAPPDGGGRRVGKEDGYE